MSLSLLIVIGIFAIVALIKIQGIFLKAQDLKECLKQDNLGEYASQGFLRDFVIALKMAYYAWFKDLPNYAGVRILTAAYGKTFRFKLLFKTRDYIISESPIYAKRIMADSTWSDRFPEGFYCQDAGFQMPYGLFFGGGKFWKGSRQTAVHLLQKFGFYNPPHMEGHFLFEMQELIVKEFDAKMDLNGGDHTFCPGQTFSYLSTRVLLHILLGKRNEFDEATLTKIVNCIKTTNKKMSLVWGILEVIPFLRHVPKLTFMTSFHDMSNFLYAILREAIAEKRRLGKYKHHAEDLVDGLLQLVDKSKGYQNGLNEKNMLVILRDLLFAGADTTSAMLEYGLMYMARHPQVQKRVQKEIHDVVGPELPPVYKDRKRMPYTQAVLNEIYRLSSPVPFTARTIPKARDCPLVVISLYGIHRNKFFYEEPNKFKPERFLAEENPNKVINTEHLMPFGYGRRSCPAELPARVAVFVYFVVMMQKYSIRQSEDHPPPSLKNCHGITRSPLPYFITIRKLLH